MSDTYVELAAMGGGTGLDGVDGYPHAWAGAFPPRPLQQNHAGLVAAPPELFAASLAELALTVRHIGIQDEQQALAVIAAAAVNTLLGGAEQATVVAPAGPDRLTIRSAHGELIPLVVELSNEAGQGPLLEAAQQRAVITVEDLSTETRWPQFTARAVTLGVRSVLCTPLAADGVMYGSLVLVADQPAAFIGDAAARAAVFAAHAALALTGARQVRNLTAMSQSRDDIGQAKGILMERHKITASAAFAVLVHTSQDLNIKLHQVCQHLADTGELPTQR